MVKIYLKDKNEYFDIEYSSILKIYFMGWIAWTLIGAIFILVIFFLISLM